MGLMELCLVPVIMSGAMVTLHPNEYHTSNRDGAYMEIQTCNKGFGGHALASTSGFAAGGIHYGVALELPYQTKMIVQPFFGGSYTARETRELPQTAQFWTGANVMLEWNGYVVGAKWGHASNAGMTKPNIGLDWIGAYIGSTF